MIIDPRQITPLADNRGQHVRRHPLVSSLGLGENVVLKLFSLAFLFLLSSCASTTIHRNPLDLKTFELAARGSTPLALQIKAYAEPETSAVGHQFLLVLLPFGSVRFDSPTEYTRSELYRRLAILGYRPMSSSTTSQNVPTLEVEIQSLSLNAYDLIVTRRVVADVRLRLVLRNALGAEQVSQEVAGHSAQFHRFGFRTELTEALETAFEEALGPLEAFLSRSRFAVPAGPETW